MTVPEARRRLTDAIKAAGLSLTEEDAVLGATFELEDAIREDERAAKARPTVVTILDPSLYRREVGQ